MSCTPESDTSIPPQKWDQFSIGLKATVTVQWPIGCRECAAHPNCRHSFGDAQPNPEHQGKAVCGARMHAISKDPLRLNSHLQQCCSCLGLLGWQHPSPSLLESQGGSQAPCLFWHCQDDVLSRQGGEARPTSPCCCFHGKEIHEHDVGVRCSNFPPSTAPNEGQTSPWCIG